MATLPCCADGYILPMVTLLSTRGARASLETALFEGLAPDGGLYMPDPLPRLSDNTWTGEASSFQAVASLAMQELLAGHLVVPLE